MITKLTRIGLVGLLCAGILAGCRAAPATETPAAAPAAATEAPEAPTASAAATAAPTRPIPALKLTAAPVVPAPPTEETPMNEAPVPTPLDAGMQAIIAQASQDLARRLSVDPAKIELVEASMVTWPDGSLGCPQPGIAYTQVMVDGLRLRFRVGQQVYAYHSGGSRPPFLCEQTLK